MHPMEFVLIVALVGVSAFLGSKTTDSSCTKGAPATEEVPASAVPSGTGLGSAECKRTGYLTDQAYSIRECCLDGVVYYLYRDHFSPKVERSTNPTGTAIALCSMKEKS